MCIVDHYKTLEWSDQAQIVPKRRRPAGEGIQAVGEHDRSLSAHVTPRKRGRQRSWIVGPKRLGNGTARRDALDSPARDRVGCCVDVEPGVVACEHVE